MYSSKVQITRHGFPAATEFEGISLFTRLHAPIIQLSPIFTLGRIVVLAPMKQLLPIDIEPYIDVSGLPTGGVIFLLL